MYAWYWTSFYFPIIQQTLNRITSNYKKKRLIYGIWYIRLTFDFRIRVCYSAMHSVHCIRYTLHKFKFFFHLMRQIPHFSFQSISWRCSIIFWSHSVNRTFFKSLTKCHTMSCVCDSCIVYINSWSELDKHSVYHIDIIEDTCHTITFLVTSRPMKYFFTKCDGIFGFSFWLT